MVNPEIPLTKYPCMDSPTLDIRSMANPWTPPDKVSVDSMYTLTYILHTLDVHNITNPWIPLDKVSKVSLDTLPRGYPLVRHTMYVQQWSEYPWNLCILCQRVSMGWQYYVCPTLVRVSMESLPKLTLESTQHFYSSKLNKKVHSTNEDHLEHTNTHCCHSRYTQPASNHLLLL